MNEWMFFIDQHTEVTIKWNNMYIWSIVSLY